MIKKNRMPEKKNEYFHSPHSFFILVLFMFILSVCKMQASTKDLDSLTSPPEEEQQEFSYDELVQKIKSKQKGIVSNKIQTPWEQVKIYPSFGFIQTMSNVKIPETESILGGKETFFQRGLQISIGIELFSPYWYSETSYRNFGVTQTKDYEISLKELDFKIGHKNYFYNEFEYRLGLGVSTRNFRLTSERLGIHNENKNPAMITSFGILKQLSPSHVLVGLEADARTLLVPSDVDKGSFGLNFIMMGYF